MWEQEWWKLRNKWISFIKQYYLQGCGVFCTLYPCLVQISWETQAKWLRTMQEDARIYRAISIVQSPQRLIYYRAYLSGSANSHHPFLSSVKRWTAQPGCQVCFTMVLLLKCFMFCSTIRLPFGWFFFPPLLSTFNKQLQVVLSCYLVKINDLGNWILAEQLTVQNKIINTWDKMNKSTKLLGGYSHYCIQARQHPSPPVS